MQRTAIVLALVVLIAAVAVDATQVSVSYAAGTR